MTKSKLTGFEYLEKLVKKRGKRDELKEAKFLLEFENGRKILCKFDIAGITDNGVGSESPRYEEYFGIYFVNFETGKDIEVSKHKSPIRIIIDGEEVYSEE